MKRMRFKLSPELVDGDHWTVVDTTDAVIEAVKTWCAEIENCYAPGDGFSVELVEMTDEEVAALREI